MGDSTDKMAVGDDGLVPPPAATPVYQTTWTEDGLVATLPMAVAAVAGVEIEELPPLYDVVDPEALETVLTSVSGAPGSVTFPYAEYTVTVRSTGSLELWHYPEQ